MEHPEKNYTVKQVAELAGVSVRTLHFYDEIGLLRPAFVAANGYRYYGRRELERLQDILFYRELGFPLEHIRGALDAPHFDRLTALKAHRGQIETQAVRLAHLIQTIDRTIACIETETTMKPEEMYRGISPEKQAEYETYLTDRYGDCAKTNIAEAKQRTRHWKAADYQAAKEENDRLNRDFAAQLRAGAAPDAAAVQALVQRHYRMIEQHWTPNRAAYVGLGKMYLDHPEFRSYYESFDPGLPTYLAKAMEVYAERELAA